MEKYFDLINDDIGNLTITQINAFDCQIQDEKWGYYIWFFLSKSPSWKAYTICDINFHRGKDWKFKPRLTFRRTDENLQDKPVQRNTKFQRITFAKSDDWCQEFWKMIWFLKSFKNIIDVWDFDGSFSVISKDITIDNISEWYDEDPDWCKDLLVNLLSSKWKISWMDLQNLINRKEQCKLFQWIVSNDIDIINGLREKYGTSQTEKTIEKFLEDNSWILWLSLDAVLYNSIDESLKDLKRIQEQIPGRPEHNFDILTETTALNIVELKLPNEKLFNMVVDSHGNPKWNPNVFEYITQIQNYRRVFEQVWNSRLVPDWKKIICPSTYLIIWRLSDMTDDQIKIFDMYRKNLYAPKIITYDELLERAKKIVNSDHFSQKQELISDDLPF